MVLIKVERLRYCTEVLTIVKNCTLIFFFSPWHSVFAVTYFYVENVTAVKYIKPVVKKVAKITDYNAGKKIRNKIGK